MTIHLDEEDCGCTEYRELSRRQFVGTAAGGSMAAVAASYFPAWLPKVVLAESYASTRDVILSVFMRGGADGLSEVECDGLLAGGRLLQCHRPSGSRVPAHSSNRVFGWRGV